MGKGYLWWLWIREWAVIRIQGQHEVVKSQCSLVKKTDLDIDFVGRGIIFGVNKEICNILWDKYLSYWDYAKC